MSKTAVDSKNHTWFFKKLAAARNRVLLVDYDGTVAPFSSDRRRAIPYLDVPDLMRRVMTTCRTRLIVITGRAAHEVAPLLGFSPPPETWGIYGLERLHPDGRHEEGEVAEEALRALAKGEARLDREGLGRFLEIKLAAVAVHWRGLTASQILNVRTKAYKVLEPLAQPDLVLSEFDGGVELRIRAASKGNAVRSLLAELDDDVPVAYLGDDVADEEAFRALNGRGLTVLVNSKPRFTAAQLCLRPPDELIGFLMDWIRACDGDS